MITITDKEFIRLTYYIKENYGINLKKEKQSLITGRLQYELIEHDFVNFTQYIDYIMADKTGKATSTMVDKLTTNHTFFMRESSHFFYYRDNILPYLKSTVSNKDLRIWSAGCSTGEEPYTLAMITNEFFGRDKMKWDTKILATDISGEVIGKAKKGIFKKEEISVLPTYWKLNYLQKYDNENYTFTDKLKEEVIFRQFNLMNQIFPFKKKLHVIFCRNVMIYFDNATRYELIQKFYDALEYGGYLFIGHSESLNRGETKFKYVMPAIYRK